jgi:hypothetical protein
VCGGGERTRNLSRRRRRPSRSRNPLEPSPVSGIYCTFADSTLGERAIRGKRTLIKFW